MRALALGVGMMLFGGPATLAEPTESPAGAAAPAEMPDFDLPQPTKEHEWLQRFVGEWAVENEMHLAPDQPPATSKGTESTRSLGGFWVIADGTCEMMGMSMKSVLTLGYDPAKEIFVGTWIDSVSSQRWEYEGTLDEGGKVLTLTTRGFCPMEGKLCDFRTTIEFKSDRERVLVEKRKSDDGSWATALVSRAVRKEAKAD